MLEAFVSVLQPLMRIIYVTFFLYVVYRCFMQRQNTQEAWIRNDRIGYKTRGLTAAIECRTPAALCLNFGGLKNLLFIHTISPVFSLMVTCSLAFVTLPVAGYLTLTNPNWCSSWK